ncbi:hypothetical protein UPYG_G00255840 [Umbra pygmaea]|uniref:MAX gene-associated protein-like n=1 Tax=Umbra pygmaea TaxID=75934 RepID=A0ABD0WYG6_UMBPY
MEERIEDPNITTSVNTSISSDCIYAELSRANKDGNIPKELSPHSEASLAISVSIDSNTTKESSVTVASPLGRKGNIEAKPSPNAGLKKSCADLALPSATVGPVPGDLLTDEEGLSAVRSCGNVVVTLENSSVWKEFHRCGTEMILTKPGRRMFPYCRYRLTGLEPSRRYALFLSITPVDPYRHRWNLKEWEPSGTGEPHAQGSCRVFIHQDSSALGKFWMATLVSFYKLKLTNHCLDREGLVLLHSMHHYRPSLHVIPVADGDGLGFDPKLLDLEHLGSEVMTFTFPQTEFYAVTAYQNTRITQLKIDYNPFAKGFREESGSPRLTKPKLDQSLAGKGSTRSPGLTSTKADGGERTEQTVTVNVMADLSIKNCSSQSVEAVLGALKRISPSSAPTADSDPSQTDVSASEEGLDLDDSDSDHVFHKQYLRAQLALPTRATRPVAKLQAGVDRRGQREGAGGELDSTTHRSLTGESQNAKQSTLKAISCSESSNAEKMDSEVPESETIPHIEPLVTLTVAIPKPDADNLDSSTPKTPKLQNIKPKTSPPNRTPSPLTPCASPFVVPKPWKKGRKPGGNRWGNVTKVSKGTKVATVAVTTTSCPVTVAMQPELDDVEGLLFVSFTSKEALGVHVEDVAPINTSQITQEQPEKTVVESDEEKIVRLQAVLLQDLNTLKHRQTIHPVLQEVGLKLSTLDPGLAIDLQYLGVCLPLPPPLFSKLGNATSGDGSKSFVSRTGKTSDLTKIKGWRDKFTMTKETSHNPNRSAFCSDMLDQYLESEAQRIRDRAEAFSHNPLASVAYQLPVTSTSYVRTLDSVLKTRTPPPTPRAFSKPCPLSRKPLLYAALKMPPPPIHSSPPKVAKPTQSKQGHTSPALGKGRAASVLRPIQISSNNKSTVAKATAGVKVTSPAVQKSPPSKGTMRRESSPGGSLPGGLPGLSKGQLRLNGLSKIQLKMMEMEEAAFYQGHDRTHITTERLETALAALLTAQGIPKGRGPKASPVEGPDCGSEFCRLGCVCSSLARVSRGPLHCYRPDCMLGCSCFKRRITRHPTVKNQDLPVYTVSNVEHQVQASRGLHVSKLWDRSTGDDPEPLFTPKAGITIASPPPQIKQLTRISQPCPKRYKPRNPPEPSEQDKDPVYKYFESMMTCARVREFNSKPPPKVLHPGAHLFNENPSFNTPNREPQKINAILSPSNKPVAPGKSPSVQAKKPKGPEPTRQLEIQSECNWDQHRKLVLGVLCRRMTQNRLSEPFDIGPYHVRLLSNTSKRRSEGTILIFKICISKVEAKVASDGDESSSEATDNSSNDSYGDDKDEEDFPQPEPDQVGVTPFLTGMMPAGRLRARKKQPACPAVGLIQVNGKSYSQARLLLGQMGALHPANRLAAFVTGRLRSVAKTANSAPQKAKKTPAGLKAAATVGPPRGTGIISSMAKKVFQTSAGKNKFPPYRPMWSRGVKSTGKTFTGQTSTTTDSEDPAGSRMLVIPMAAAPAPPPNTAPPVGKMLLQTVSSSQGCKLYRQPNGQLIKLVPLNNMRPIKPKNQESVPGSATPQMLPPPPPLTSCPPPPHAPLIKFITGPSGALSLSQSSSSPVSLTVSSSLKTPSFLGHTGTYSFRICPPPAGDQGSKGQGSAEGTAGVALPGGFTLIQLPKPGVPEGAPRLPTLIRTTAIGEAVRASHKVDSSLETKPSSGPAGEQAQEIQQHTPSSPAVPSGLKQVKLEDQSYIPVLNTNTPNSRSVLDQKKQSNTETKVPKSEHRSIKAKTPSWAEPNELTCNEQMLSDESDTEKREVGEVGEGLPLWSPESWKKDTNFSRFSSQRMHPDFKVDDSDSEDSSNDSDSDSDEYTSQNEEEAVDIETVEERRQGIAIAQMRAAVKHTKKNCQDEKTAPRPTEKRDKREEEGSGSGEGSGPKSRTLTERLRRGEHQKLFTRLKQVLFMEEMDPKVSKLHLLSQALKEIRTLSVDSESLQEKKRMLMEIQSVYVKEIAYMSGKPEQLIKAKLKEIWETKRTFAAQRRKASTPSSSTTQPPSSAPLTPSSNTLTVSKVSLAGSQDPAGVTSGSVKPVAAVLRTKNGKILLPASMLPASMLHPSRTGRAVYKLKVMKRPATPTPSSSTPPASERADHVLKEGRAEEKQPSPPNIYPSQPLCQTSNPQLHSDMKDQVPMKAKPPSGNPAGERPDGVEEELQAPNCNRSSEEIFTAKDNRSTAKKYLINKKSIKRLSTMCPLVEIEPINSDIWRLLEEPQVGGESDPDGWGLSLTKGEAAMLVKALSEHEDMVVARKDKDGSVQHKGNKNSVMPMGRSIKKSRKDCSELQEENGQEDVALTPEKVDEVLVTPTENDGFTTQKATGGSLSSQKTNSVVAPDGLETPPLKRKRGRPRSAFKTPPAELLTAPPAPRGRPPKDQRIGVYSPVVTTVDSTASVMQAAPCTSTPASQPADSPLKRATNSSATRGRPPKLRKSGDGSCSPPVTRAGISPARYTRAGGSSVVKTEVSAAKLARGDSPANATRAAVNSPAPTTKGSPGNTPQTGRQRGTRPVTRAVAVKDSGIGKRTMRSDKS